MLKLKAVVKILIPLKRDITQDFPFSIGALTLMSKDDERNYVLDGAGTSYLNTYTEGEIFQMETNCKVDLESFPLDKNSYNITEEDLKDCKGTFYCSDVDNEDGEDCFDYDTAKAVAFVTDLDTGKVFQIPVTLEV